MPFDQVVRIIQSNVVHYLVGAAWSKEWSAVNVLSSVPLDIPLLQEVGGKIAYGRTHRSADEDVNFLCREFTEDGKLTIVAQHIHEDENLPLCKVQCNRMFWYVHIPSSFDQVTVDRISDDISTLRVLFLSSHYFNQYGSVPFNDECHYHWGLDLSHIEGEAAKLAAFHRHIARAGNEFVGALVPLLHFV
ncbi:hypothetical protein AaE_004706 [Aphanomyces astaci]|uniref:Uncharacterized protein n=1 Tax=Aphanomyces astaci TaxID=112090 RepID=A0A6A5AN97_APHAT|nr:hypothetical protein AaE_004706 [Aphanomyces astaci]